MKTEGVGKKMKKKGKGESEKGEKRLKNASLRVKKLKNFRPSRRVGEKTCGAIGLGGGDDQMCNIYT